MADISARQLRVATYARVSTEEQKEGQTIDSQVTELERFAADRNWLVIDVYKDDGWSGALLARPELDRLRDDATKGVFDAVLINDVDRLARDVTHLGIVKRDLERKGIQVIFRKLPADNSPTQNLMVNILGSFAEFERELIADRTRRGRVHKVEVRKQYLGGNTSYGYNYIPMDQTATGQGILEIAREEAAVVRQMFAWVDVEGLSARRVLNRLNERRISPRKGAQTWSKSSVLRILHNQMYAGVWHYNKFQSFANESPPKGKVYRRHVNSGKKLRQRGEWIPLQLLDSLRIVDHAQWLRVQEQLKRNTAFSPRNEKHSYLLKSLVQCGGCGSRYVGEPCHGKFYYRCIRRCKRCPTVREEVLNKAVWGAIRDAILNPAIIADQIEQRMSDVTAQAQTIEESAHEAERALGQIQSEETRLIEAYRLEALSPAQLGSELEKLSARRRSIETAQETVNREQLGSSPVQAKKSVLEYCTAIATRLGTFDHDDVRHLLRTLIRRVIFHGTHIHIQGEVPLDASPESGSPTPHEPIDPNSGIATTTASCRGRNSGRKNLRHVSNSVEDWGQLTHTFEIKVQVSVVHDTTRADAARRAHLLKAMANRWPNHRFRRRVEHILRTPQLLSPRASHVLRLPGDARLADSS
jgi:site-specific DNA recombinase